MFYLWVSHRYTCEHPWVTCTCAMPYHPQTTQWLIQYCTCPYGLTGQQKSTETWASAPSHLPRSHTAQAHHHPVKWWCGTRRMHPHNCCAHHTSHIHLHLAYRPHRTCTHTSTMRTPTNCTPIVDMPVTPALVNPDPSDATPNTPMPANFDGTLVECTTCTHIASANPAPITVFMATSPVVPAVFTPSIVHGLCDFLALCSDS